MTEYYYAPDNPFKIRKIENNQVYFYGFTAKQWIVSDLDKNIVREFIKIPEHLALLWIAYD